MNDHDFVSRSCQRLLSLLLSRCDFARKLRTILRLQGVAWRLRRRRLQGVIVVEPSEWIEQMLHALALWVVQKRVFGCGLAEKLGRVRSKRRLRRMTSASLLLCEVWPITDGH